MAVRLTRCSFAELSGWEHHDHAAALDVFRRSCRRLSDVPSYRGLGPVFGGSPEDWRTVCSEAVKSDAARIFFETFFVPCRVIDPVKPDGLFTGYFEPEVQGSLARTEAFHVPIYSVPPDLVSFTEDERSAIGLTSGRRRMGRAEPYLTREEIEEGALAGQGLEIAWLRDWGDAYFLQIQGSGRIRMVDGTTLRLSFAAKSGHLYTSIGSLLAERGQIEPDKLSMQSIRHWMTCHPRQARELMWENRSFIFFQRADLAEPHLGAFGAQRVQLTPQRSIAIDRSYWAYGTPIWLDTEAPLGDEGSMKRFRQLLVAQDTGSAIRGAARGDVYWGFGDSAGRIAGPMKSAGQMTVLLPYSVARRIGLMP